MSANEGMAVWGDEVARNLREATATLKTSNDVADEANYRYYRNQRALYGIAPERLARSRLWGEVQVVEYEARYRREVEEEQRNAGARLADDHVCQGCGARGIVGFCAGCRV